MRNRFFLTIMAVLTIVTVASIVIHALFLHREMMSLIDQQVRDTAAALVDSQLGDLRKIDFERAERIISEELGENRIGKFFIIRNNNGEVLFKSTSAQVLPLNDVPREPRWITFRLKGQFIRVLNLKLPSINDRTLQVGIVVDEDLISQNYFSRASFIFITAVLAIGFAASVFLTSFLLKPIAQIENFLTGISNQVRNQSYLPNVPKKILSGSSTTSLDEFQRMVVGLNALIDKVNRNFKFSRLWAYQMAHELKTPLAILNLKIEKLQDKTKLVEEDARPLRIEGDKLLETINSFLSWAEIENTPHQGNLFVNRLGALTKLLCRRLEDGHANRIILDIQADPTIVASPPHLEQMISNLVMNALTYSEPSAPVTVLIKEGSICVIDGGKGFPKDVLERLGEPFNRGGQTGKNQKRGHGLGLAWVQSICRLYSWEMKVMSTEWGSKVSILFPVAADAFKTDELNL